MKTKILIVEHDPNDLELMQYELKKGGINYVSEIVQNEYDFGIALKNFNPDIILSDFSLPSFDGPTAFKIREQIAPDTPFIFVSGTIGEENSIEYIKNGLTDYALKDKLFTLTSKVNRALTESEEKKKKSKYEEERKLSERRFAKAQQVAQKKLKKQNEELIKTNMELDRFVYSVSHDLRAPLTSVLGLLSFIEGETKEADTLEHAGMIRNRINRLDGFIQKILSYSKNNRTEIGVEQIPVQKTIEETFDMLSNMKDAEGIKFEVNIDAKEPFFSDLQRFTTVIENLISNAIKYHKREIDGRFIKVTGTTYKDKLCLKIEDNGVGIAPEYHQKIFEMFYHLPGNKAGTGIGLYIVKEIIEKLEGSIHVNSKNGKGTSFELNFKNLNT